MVLVHCGALSRHEPVREELNNNDTNVFWQLLAGAVFDLTGLAFSKCVLGNGILHVSSAHTEEFAPCQVLWSWRQPAVRIKP